jgi:hypothetical protein
MTARPGFTIGNWRSAPVFDGHCATPADVEGAAAVFALADTLNGRPLQMDKPAPVIWYSEDEEFAALVVQAEAHETEDDGILEFLGLLLPSGETAVVFADDLEFVQPTDPVWLALLEADGGGEDDKEEKDGAEWAGLDLPDGEGKDNDWREKDLN